jgi:hypothetical protein
MFYRRLYNIDIGWRLADLSGNKYVYQFCRQMKRSLGMECLVLTSHMSRDGHVVFGSHHHGEKFGGYNLKAEFPNWRAEPIMEVVKRHGNMSFGALCGLLLYILIIYDSRLRKWQ